MTSKSDRRRVGGIGVLKNHALASDCKVKRRFPKAKHFSKVECLPVQLAIFWRPQYSDKNTLDNIEKENTPMGRKKEDSNKKI